MPTEFPEIRLPCAIDVADDVVGPAPDIHPASVVAEVDVAGHVGADVVADDLVGAAPDVDLDAVTAVSGDDVPCRGRRRRRWRSGSCQSTK